MTTLDTVRILELLAAAGAGPIDEVNVFDKIASTNSYLIDQPAPMSGHFRVAVADYQTAGRGRSGNRWISAPGRSLCLSVAYTLCQKPDNLPALTLALGVSIAEMLVDLGASGVHLKWPNDLVANGAKLGGLLVETQYRSDEDIVVIAGLGLNMQLPDRINEELQSAPVLRAVGLESLLPTLPAREDMAVLAIQACCSGLREFEAGGFAAFARRYAALDWLAGKAIAISNTQESLAGIADGVDDNGALRVATGKGTRSVLSGTINAVAQS